MKHAHMMSWRTISRLSFIAGLSIAAFSLLPALAQALPDQRAYEQASPVDKNGTNIVGGPDYVHASPAGDRVVYFSSSPLPNSSGASGFPLYLSSRGQDDWSTAGLLPAPVVSGNLLQTVVVGWSADLTETLLTSDPGADPSVFGLFLRDSSDGSLTQITAGGGGDNYAFDAATPDDKTILFEDRASNPLVPGGTAGAGNVYQWSKAGGLSLVSVLPDGTTPPGGAFAGPYSWSSSDPSSGGALAHLYTSHTISNDGSRVFFTAAGTGQLYVRKNGTQTVQVSASQKTNGAGPQGTDPNGPHPAAFMAASSDGAKVLFTSPEELTNDANTGSADQGNDLYSFDVDNGQLTDLTVDADLSDSNGASVQGVLGTSDDGSYVYFVALGALAGGATSGQPNLYVEHDGTTTFIATLSAAQHSGQVDSINWQPKVTAGVEKAAQVTPDGHTLLFASELPLTSDDNQGHTEFYRYSAPSSELTCVSCRPDGSPSQGDGYLQGPSFPVLLPPAHQTTLPDNISNDGDRIFFDSSDSLLPQDTNGQLDIYEWEANGKGSCQAPAGCVSLISTGQSPDPSFLTDASASGDDVFFVTSQSLVGQDQDQLVDEYDARVGGGLTAQNPSTGTPCEGEVCKLPSAPVPSYQEPGSSIYSGPGNPTPIHGTPKAHHKHKHRGHHHHHRAARKGGHR